MPQSSGQGALTGLQLLTQGAVTVALVSALTYLVAFQYESQFFRAHGISSDLLELYPEEIIAVISRLFVVALGTMGVLNLISALWPPRVELRERLSRIWWWVTLPAWWLVSGPLSWSGALLLLVSLVVVLILEVVVPIARYRDRGSITERLIHDEASKKEEAPQFWVLDSVAGLLGPHFLVIAFYGFIAVFLAGQAGSGAAMKSRTVYMSTTTPPAILVRAYPSRIIAAVVDSTGTRLSGDLLVLQGSEVSQVRWTRRVSKRLILTSDPQDK